MFRLKLYVIVFVTDMVKLDGNAVLKNNCLSFHKNKYFDLQHCIKAVKLRSSNVRSQCHDITVLRHHRCKPSMFVIVIKCF